MPSLIVFSSGHLYQLYALALYAHMMLKRGTSPCYCSGQTRLNCLGETHHVPGSVEDGVVLSDEDIIQDSEVGNAIAEPSAATIIILLERFRRQS